MEIVAGIERHFFRLTFETQACRALQQENPFSLVLIVPETFGRGVTAGYDPLHAQCACDQKIVDKLLR